MISKVFQSLVFVVVLVLGLSECAAAISTLSGIVRDPGGNPVAGVDLDFIDPATGIKLITPGDNTDINGFYSVTVLNSQIYTITFATPYGAHVRGRKFLDVDLRSSLEFDVVLEYGLVISGQVTTTTGNPVGRVDIDVDSLDGGRVFAPNDDSSPLDGTYWIVVPSGYYRLRYDSPVGSRLTGLQIDSVAITSDTVIDISLAEGNLLSGRVTNFAAEGLFDIDLDLRDAITGEKVFVSNNSTDTAGAYNIAVPTGLFEFRVSPPQGSRYVGAKVDSFSITGDVVWDQTLDEGYLVSVVVSDSTGRPVPGADVDFKRDSDGVKLYTPHDATDISGVATVTIPFDLYTLQVDPPLGSLFDQVILTGIDIRDDTTIMVLMPEVPRVRMSGTITDDRQSPVASVTIDLRHLSTNSKVYVVNNLTDSAGHFDFAVPTGMFDLNISTPVGSRQVSRVIRNVSIGIDTSLGLIGLETGIVITVLVTDRTDNAIAAVDLDFIDEATGVETFTPQDNTDGSGRAVVTIAPGAYTVRATPPPTHVGLTLTGQLFSTDTDIVMELKRRVSGTGDALAVLDQNYPNPFNNLTVISYAITEGSDVFLAIYNTLGQRVKVLKNSYHTTDYYEVIWDGKNDNGRSVASGVYFCRLRMGDFDVTRSMILIK